MAEADGAVSCPANGIGSLVLGLGTGGVLTGSLVLGLNTGGIW